MGEVEPDESEQPVRLLVRYLAEYLFAAGARWVAFTGGDPINATLIRLTLATNLSRLPFADERGWYGLDAVPIAPRALTASAAARSLGLPFETVRSRVHGLRRAGKLAGGRAELLAVAPLAETPGFAEFIAGEGGAFRSVIADIALVHDPAGRLSSVAAALDRMPPSVAARLANDYSLRCAEDFITAHGNMLAAVVLNGLVVANTRPIRADPLLSQRFASESEIPPDELRTPVSARALARELALPAETVRRQIHALAVQGAIEARDRQGWIVPARRLIAADFAQRNRHVVRSFSHVLDRVVRLDRDFG